MSEVLGDAEPPYDERRYDEDDRVDRDHDQDGDEFAGSRAARRFVVDVATPPSLALASIVMAGASLLNLPAVNSLATAFALRHPFSDSITNNIEPIGALVVAITAASHVEQPRGINFQPAARAATQLPPPVGNYFIEMSPAP